MKAELSADFGVPDHKSTVIPFGINNTLPVTALTRNEARQRLGIGATTKTLLFFGNIAPYKGLEYLVDALALWSGKDSDFRLIIAGKPKGFAQYWEDVQAAIISKGLQERVIAKIEYIPDESVEVYFKAADVLVIPYTHVFQSGVLFLGYSFGLPVIATDVGSLREEIVEGETGFICRPEDSADLARAIEQYFGSALFAELEARRSSIRAFANDRYSWAKVARLTQAVYTRLLTLPR
jgi:glycosyltransferase involved in cell wall biosynthesis